MYHFESAHGVCNQVNRLINTPRKEERMEGTEIYPGLDDSNERKYISDKEILEKLHRFRKFLSDEKGKEGSEEFRSVNTKTHSV